MTENEKIELFDKWYDENYDEWAEGEEGIALREELEQAFKGGIAELEKKNADLKEEVNKIAFARGNLEEENAELEKENAELKERADKADLDSVLFFNQLCKAKKLLKKVVTDFHNMDCVTVHIDKTIAEAEQFLSEVKK